MKILKILGIIAYTAVFAAVLAFADGKPTNTVVRKLAYTMSCKDAPTASFGKLCPGSPYRGEGYGLIVFQDDPSKKIPILISTGDSLQFAQAYGGLHAEHIIAQADHPTEDPVIGSPFWISGYFGTSPKTGNQVFFVTEAKEVPRFAKN